MRLLGVWLFMMLNIICFGMVGYMYLIWKQFWRYSDSHRPSGDGNTRGQASRAFLSDAIDDGSETVRVRQGKPLFHPGNIHVEDLIDYEPTVVYGPFEEDIEEQNSNNHAAKETPKEGSKAAKKKVRTKRKRKKIYADEDEFYDEGGKVVTTSKAPTSTAVPSKVLMKMIEDHKMSLTVHLRTSQMDGGNILFKHENQYGVVYPKKEPRSVEEIMQRRQEEEKIGYSVYPLAPSREKLFRELKAAEVRTLRDGDEPFTAEGLSKYFPSLGIMEGEHYNSCAVVSSAGSLKGAGLGKFIDSHDVVVRFNHAPVKFFTSDVGSKTTLRIINSQVIAKPEFHFWESELYSNISILVWDPSNYTVDLKQWYENPDFDFFSDFFKRRLMMPRESLHLLHPESLWNLWRVLQKFTLHRVLPNPPSSGFLGLALMLRHCNIVNIFEYIPSLRLSTRCHYWKEETDTGCTFGSWHPLATEKLVTMVLNEADDVTTYKKGYATIRGFSNLRKEEV